MTSYPNDAAMADALHGVRVVDLTLLLPGPMATLRLAQWGAEVLKVEPPGPGDGARELFRTAAQRAQGEPSHFWQALNAGKSVHRLDLRSEAGLGQLRAWVREADVLVEGFRPGVMQRLGVGYAELASINPRLVYCAITGYGQRSPWALHAGHDINYMAMSGVLEQVATSDGTPAVPNLQVGDLLGGTQAALSATLAALVGAQRSGRGRFVDISMTHELLRHHVVVRLALETRGATPPPARDLLSGGAACYGVYRTADARWLAVGALEPKFWAALCAALGQADWTQRHWAFGERPGSEAALATREALVQRIAQQPLAHWTERLGGPECCTTPVLRVDEALSHPLFGGP